MSSSAKRIIGIVAVVVAVSCVGAFAFDRYALSQTYARTRAPEVSLLPTYDLFEKDYPRTDVQFQLNGYTLRGHVYGADNSDGLIVFRHGIFSQHQDYLALITALVDKGWRVFAYDAIACGESDGDSVLGMSQSPLDVAAAIDFARQSGLADGMPLVLFGHSWGGYGVAAALGLRPNEVDACVSMSGYDAPVEILTASAESSYGLVGRLQAPFMWLNCVVDFGMDNANRSASEAVVASGVPTLVIHGSGDAVVPYEGVSILSALRDKGVGAQGESTVKLITKADAGRNGHNDYFYSRESQAYLNECADTLKQLLEENGSDAESPAVREFRAHVDMHAANTADPELIDEIDSFLKATTNSSR